MAHETSSAPFPPARRSALFDEHRARDATFVVFAGWDMPLRYSSDTGEHDAVRRAAGLFDLSHMGEIALTGARAGEALDFALVGELSSLAVGGARYTMLCADDGGVLDDLVVYRTASDAYLVVANAVNTAIVADTLRDRAAVYEAEVVDETGQWSLLGLQGPAAVAILSPLADEPVDSLKRYSAMPARVGGVPAMVARTGYTGEDGFEIFVREGAPELWRMLLEQGQGSGLVPAGLACRDSLRLEAGMPLYGNELSKDRTPFEAGLGRVVRLDKPCGFVGRAALAARRDHPVSEVLVGLAGEGRRAPRAGHLVLTDGAKRAGVVTSGLPSPTLGYSIAMAYVDVEVSVPGTCLVADVRGQRQPVTVVELPFYRRPRG